MKRSIVLAILTVAGGATLSYGQGTVGFFNYFGSTSPLVTYGTYNVPPGKAGLALGGSFAAELFFFAGGVTTDESALTPVPSSLTYFSFSGPGPNPTADGDIYDAGHPNGNGAGWWLGPNLALPGTSAGEVVTLEVWVFNNGSLAAATVAGNSGLFNLALGGGLLPPASLAGMWRPSESEPLPIGYTPEPTTLALGMLGGSSLWLFRRKTKK